MLLVRLGSTFSGDHNYALSSRAITMFASPFGYVPCLLRWPVLGIKCCSLLLRAIPTVRFVSMTL